VRILFLSVFIVLADQATKLIVKGFSFPFLGIQVRGMGLGASKPILGDFLKLTYIENPGMAFGIDLGGKLFFSIFSIAASIGILYYLYKSKGDRFSHRFALAMILGGAVGNLIDRVFYGLIFESGQLFQGRVVDFIDVDFFDVNFFGYHLSRWPVFNLADASVTVGVVFLILFHRRSKQESKEEVLLTAPNYQEAGANSPHGSLPTPPITDPIPHSREESNE
jgi:signal peptidase II